MLVNGGGNLGDLYAGQQGTRLEILRSLRDNRIIQLPQSIHFANPENAQAMAQLISEHGGFELMVRERKSLRLAKDLLGLDATLSPDHALALGSLDGSHAPTRSVLWLARRPGDPEYVPYDEPSDARVTRMEWLEGVSDSERDWDRRGRLALRFNGAAKNRRLRGPESRLWKTRAAYRALSMTYPVLARRWVARGVGILTDAEVVITDKLHGHIMCVLLGKEHIVLDNSYGKVSGTLDAWTGTLPGVHRATDGRDAMEQAVAILESR
ncbi:pyruvyl transferase EpsO [Sanguibacter gelidistatuariae]|uniref:Pyruvyl transferase EpsO n=1 Tax=Sanguibacter gelidistatuariae TaxID=1814289 RepID=A0A1G6VXB0_9MICO|nr:pyruvyl transferase EpsO [Sanguibacter gelidistatuariae]